MLENFDKHLKKNFPLLQTRPLLLAISGGLDSVVMLHLMRKYAKNCTIAHCNFQLREAASDLDALFVKNLGASMKIPVVSVNFDTEAYADGYASNAEKAIAPYVQAAIRANELGLGINAGHDLSLENINFFAQNIPQLLEVSIGHALVCESLYLGFENVIPMYLQRLAQ